MIKREHPILVYLGQKIGARDLIPISGHKGIKVMFVGITVKEYTDVSALV